MTTTSLYDPRVVLRPLLESEGPVPVRAASDGALWNLPFTVAPSAETIDAYRRNAIAQVSDASERLLDVSERLTDQYEQAMQVLIGDRIGRMG